MAKHVITTNSTKPLIIQGSGDTWVIDLSASITTSQIFHETAISEIKGSRGNTIIVNGAVIGGADGDDDGIVVRGRDTHVGVGNLGVVQGDAGIHAYGRQFSAVNHGDITASWTGIFSERGGVVVNDGSIHAGVGIWSNSGPVKIVNKAGAEIIGDGSAIEVQGEGASSRIINHGTLEAYYYAMDTGDLADIVTNRGVMKGTISLGAGNDVFDNRGGSVDHDIGSNEGNDTLITDDANVKMSEGDNGGRDLVKSTVSYVLNDYVENLTLIGKAAAAATGNAQNNRLDGNSADNVMQGLAGKDRLDGHGGNDILTGGTQSDSFVFQKGYGDDTITDWEIGIDRIDLRGSGFSDFADIKAHATDTGADIVLHLGKDTLRIEGVELADMSKSDFLF